MNARNLHTVNAVIAGLAAITSLLGTNGFEVKQATTNLPWAGY